MAHVMRGALIEYGTDFLGPIPNVVIFQFNPDSLARTIQVPPRPSGGASRETSGASDPPLEKFTVKAVFSAPDLLNGGNVLAKTFGVGPQLAALEKMVHPSGKIAGQIGAAIDAIGGALGGGGAASDATQPIPREKYPRILFIWGVTRILPVLIESMTITEQQYDSMLNPIEAEVSIAFSVNEIGSCSDDQIGQGAMAYTNLAKEAMAIVNLANSISLVGDLIPF